MAGRGTARSIRVGWGTLDLTTTADQVGSGPGNPLATAVDTYGFLPTDIVKLTVAFSGSAGLDNLVFSPIPEPNSYVLFFAGLGIVGTAIRRRKS